MNLLSLHTESVPKDHVSVTCMCYKETDYGKILESLAILFRLTACPADAIVLSHWL
jgi:hypothetical protein